MRSAVAQRAATHEEDDEGDGMGRTQRRCSASGSRAEEQHGEEHALDGRDEPRHADGSLVG